MRRRTIISGAGPVSALGIGIEAHWDAMCQGQTGLRTLTAFDASWYPCQIAGELDREAFKVRSIVPKSYRKAVKVMCRDVELAVGGAAEAIRHANLQTPGIDHEEGFPIDPHRLGCHIGAGLIAADVDELTSALAASRGEDGEVDLGTWGTTGMENLTPLWLLKYLPNMLACHVTIVHDCRGPSNTITCAESSSALSLGESMRIIERGSADACLTGGAESKLNPLNYYRQYCAGRLADARDLEPLDVVRPFASDAIGTAVGEGGGLMVIEALDHCLERGGTPMAEVLGYAATQSPDHNGLGATAEDLVAAMRNAIRSAGREPDCVDAIVPFGCGIPAIDAAEAEAIRTVFGDRASEIELVTTVPFTGNCNAGNGTIQIAVATQCLKTQSLPARLNAGTVELDLKAGPCDAREADLRTVLVLSASQGGQNTAILLGRHE